eukprot:5675-Heterocapsa_arctica.AAC.1
MRLVPLELRMDVVLPGFLGTPVHGHRIDPGMLPEIGSTPVLVAFRFPQVLPGPYPACLERRSAAVRSPSTVPPHANADRTTLTASFFS